MRVDWAISGSSVKTNVVATSGVEYGEVPAVASTARTL